MACGPTGSVRSHACCWQGKLSCQLDRAPQPTSKGKSGGRPGSQRCRGQSISPQSQAFCSLTPQVHPSAQENHRRVPSFLVTMCHSDPGLMAVSAHLLYHPHGVRGSDQAPGRGPPELSLGTSFSPLSSCPGKDGNPSRGWYSWTKVSSKGLHIEGLVPADGAVGRCME